VFGRGAGQHSDNGGRVGDITELLRACLAALRVPEQADADRPRPLPFWQVGDAIAHIRQLIGTVPEGSPLTAFLPAVDGAEPGRALRYRVAVSARWSPALNSCAPAPWRWIRTRRGHRSGEPWRSIGDPVIARGECGVAAGGCCLPARFRSLRQNKNEADAAKQRVR
jgi:hypothetical protein